MFKRILSIIVCMLIVASVCACSTGVNGKSELLNGERKLGTPSVSDGSRTPVDFAAALLDACFNGEDNTLVSPMSLTYALAMQMNGAEGETLKQMETVLGASREELNEFCLEYALNLPQGEKYKLDMANSVWVKNNGELEINEEFIARVSEYFDADIFSAPFDDSTVKDVNEWAKRNTDGLIKEIINKFPEGAVLALMNAVHFDAEWQSIYDKNDIRDAKFTAFDGSVQNVEMMYCDEYKYLETENATGFIKYYADRKYAFVAMLPNEDVELKEYVKSLADGNEAIKEI